jgi:hypothetical protein
VVVGFGELLVPVKVVSCDEDLVEVDADSGSVTAEEVVGSIDVSSKRLDVIAAALVVVSVETSKVELSLIFELNFESLVVISLVFACPASRDSVESLFSSVAYSLFKEKSEESSTEEMTRFSLLSTYLTVSVLTTSATVDLVLLILCSFSTLFDEVELV